MIINEVIEIVKLTINENKHNENLEQDGIISLILNDFLGGIIMKCNNHYYNIINNKIIDLTTEKQSDNLNYQLSKEVTRESILSNEDIRNRYKSLLKLVKENFIKYGKKEYKLLTKNGIILSKVPGTLGGNKSLKIYGKFDCKSALNWIKKGYYTNNRVFFENEETAIELGYRPCGVCMKKEYKLWKNTHK